VKVGSVGGGHRAGSPDEFDLRPYLSILAGVLAGPANVVMQLSRPEVGHGVVDSPVPSGSFMHRPLKRARTTFTYLAVALLGTEADRRAFARAVDGQHRQVRSARSSPLRYNAMDPELQLWVAACLAYGLIDVTERIRGPLDAEVVDRLYAHAARFGTTLQVREEMWPATREEFGRYWERGLASAGLDEPVRDYLLRLVRLEPLPVPLRLLLAPGVAFWTAGFLPPELRRDLGMAWSSADQRRFERRLGRLARLEALLPVWVRAAPFELLLADVRWRRRLGRPLV
jgi:uncharacterized protein (DUF2236 family)